MERAFITVLNMSITGSLIIAALLIIRLAFRKLPRKYSYALWAIPAFRLLCPISISSAISFFNLFKKAEVASNQMEYIAPPTEYVAPTLPQNPVVTPLPPTYHDPMVDVVKEVPKSLSLGEIAGIIWLTVAAAIILWAVISYISVRRRVKGSEKADGYFICKNIFSPFVFGIFRPTIYLPSGLSEADTHCILEHERTHIQRKDYLIKLLTVPILALHWFNPLVWLGIRLMTVDMELSCDEMALKSFSADFRKDYANALLNVSMKQNGLSFGGVLGFGETGVKARIKGVLSMKKPKLWATVIAIVIVIVAAVCLTTNAAKSSGPLPKKFDGYISYEAADIPVLHYDETVDAADFKEQAAPKILFARAEAGDVTAYLLGEGVYREENSDALRVIDLKVGVSTDGKTLNAAYPAPAEFIGASQGHYTVYTDTAAISAYLSAFDMELPIIELNYIGEDSNIGAFYAVKDGEPRLLTGDLSEIGGEASGVCFTYTALEKGSEPNTLVFSRMNSFGVEYVFDFDNIKADEYIGSHFRAEYVGGGLDGSGVNKLVKDFMIYERAFDYGSLDYASNSPADSVTIDGENYYPVTEEGFTDWQELYDFMHGLFSDDFADEALAGSPYREHDGKTYTLDVGGNGWSISDEDYRWYDGEKIEIWRPLLSEGDEGKYAITLLYVSDGKIAGFEYHYTDSLNGYQPYADIAEVNAAFEEFIIPPDGETITRLAEEYITENTDLPLHSYTAEYTAITDNVSGIQSGIIEIRYDSGAPYIRLTAAKLDGVWQTTSAAEYADYNEYLSEVSGGRPDEAENLKNVTRNFDIMSVSVDIPESWQSYTLEDYSLQHIGIQLYDGAIPAQREMYGGKLFVAEAVSGFAQSYIESQEALGVSYDVSDYTAASGYKMKLCYRDGVLDYATFDDFKSMCIFFDLDEQDDMRVIFRIIDSIVLSAESGDAPEQSYSYDEAKDILGEAFEAYAQYTSFGSIELSSDGGTAAREIKVRKSDGIFTEYAYCFTARYQSRDRLPRLYAVTADAADIFVYDPEDETDQEFYGYLTTAESYKDVPDHAVFTDFYAQAQAFYKFLQDIDSRSRIGYDQKATDEALSLSLWDDYKEASLFLHLHRRDNGDIITQGGSEYIPLNSDYDTMAECEALLRKTFTRDFSELILKNQFGRNRKFSEFNGKMYAIIGDYAGTIVCDLPISGAVYDGENRMTAYTTITYDREGDNVDDYIFHLEKENESWKIASIELPDYYADGSSRFEFTESYYYTDTLAAIETVREALEAEAKSDYVISLEINDISVDWKETYRLAEMYSGSDLAIERGWSDDDLNDRFLVISADCSAEYDRTKTSLDGGHIIRYFGLMYHEDSDDWEIIPDLGGTFSPA